MKRIALGVLVVLGVLAGVVALQPAAFRVERATVIGAPPDVPFAMVNDFRRWASWSPWLKLDPTQKVWFDEPASGAGATYSWAGNENVGEGRMTITDSQPRERVVMRLEFVKPMQATNTAAFTFRPVGDETVVSWALSGENGFVGKAIGLVMDMDEMVGRNFEEGLASMKALAEAEARKLAEAR
jgi:hypothetical protein